MPEETTGVVMRPDETGWLKADAALDGSSGEAEGGDAWAELDELVLARPAGTSTVRGRQTLHDAKRQVTDSAPGQFGRVRPGLTVLSGRSSPQCASTPEETA